MVVTRHATKSFHIAWNGGEREISLPADNVTGEVTFTDFPPIPDARAALLKAMEEPLGVPPLAELVRPGAKVALLTGDRMTDRMLGSRDGLGHVILDYLNRAGVRDEDVTLVFACGTHPHRDADEKLGPELIGRVGRYVRHLATDDTQLSFVGYTSYGNAVWLNRAVVEADVVIGFGEISPNSHGGWCGGGKMILPGVAGRATVEHNHRLVLRPGTMLGLTDSNILRLDMEEGADLGRLAFKIDVLVNSDQQIVAMYSGDFRQEHRRAIRDYGRRIWMTPIEPADVAIYSPGDVREQHLESSLFITLDSADLATKDDGVIVLAISAAGGYAPNGVGMPFNDRQHGRDLLKMSTVALARAMIDSTGNVRTASILFMAKRVLERKRVLLACEGIEPEEARSFGFTGCFRTVEAAVQHALDLKGRGASIVTCFPRGIQWRILPWRED